MMDTDPLQELVVDAHELSRSEVAQLLRGRVGLDPNRGRMVFQADDLGAKERIELALVGQRALNLLREELASGLSPQEVSDVTGVIGGTVRPILKRLSDRGWIIKDDEGRYVVTSVGLQRVGRN
jgi:hypothetical protein